MKDKGYGVRIEYSDEDGAVLNIKIPSMGIGRARANFLTSLRKSVYNARQNPQEIRMNTYSSASVIDRVKRQISKDCGFKKTYRKSDAISGVSQSVMRGQKIAEEQGLILLK